MWVSFKVDQKESQDLSPKLVFFVGFSVHLQSAWPDVDCSSVVRWHLFPLFLVAAPLKMVFLKKGSLFFRGH